VISLKDLVSIVFFFFILLIRSSMVSSLHRLNNAEEGLHLSLRPWIVKIYLWYPFIPLCIKIIRYAHIFSINNNKYNDTLFGMK
jgi:glucan phosphoethanolaminetransferase (alkaline phosphatase superfamily)